MHRSYLFAPGHNAKLLSRVFGAGADAVILDLEDAVPPHAKEQARAMVPTVLGQRPAWVRINAVRTELAAADLDAVAGVGGRHPDPQGAVARGRAMGPRPRSRHAADLRHRKRPRPARSARDRARRRRPPPLARGRQPPTRPQRRRWQPANALRTLAAGRRLARRRARPTHRQCVPARRRRPRAAPAGRVRPFARLLRQVRHPPPADPGHPRRVHAHTRGAHVGPDRAQRVSRVRRPSRQASRRRVRRTSQSPTAPSACCNSPASPPAQARFPPPHG